MSENQSRRPKVRRSLPVSAIPPVRLDEVDRQLLGLLLRDGRMSNAELARRVGVAESTCNGRVRALRAAGVITGVHAEVDLAALGRPIQAMVALRFAGHVRAEMEQFREQVATIPGVIAAYHVAGNTDFLVQVAVPTAHDLRDFVLDRLTSIAGVTHAETSLIFERIVGEDVLG
ncbi:Lrp/AsnC family transcriptional regulator [Propionibacteriaceae bacterium Y1685]|uniref:Lrp/AsnC family transcriptional regulator n=1 Tax=Microlunatus sp. Y1700 TaxID=3418487 RepID=UPI003B79493B